MTARISVKISKAHARVVAVIASRPDLHRALRMTNPPDLFELRLDRLLGCLDEVEKKISILPAPLIITARHPAEGGANRLSAQQRRDLLERFLRHARYVDVELRSAKALRPVLARARKNKIRRIISFHDLGDTPSVRVLKSKARSAKSQGADIFKVASRTDTPAQVARLLDFAANEDVDLAKSVMGMGKLGALSRIVLAQLGSVLIYTALQQPKVEGQLSIKQLRSALSRLKII
jgi:3-dehydroquinate dehydratase I